MRWPPELAERLGPGRVVAPLGGNVFRAETGGRQVVVKTGPSVADEADGLERLARVEQGPRVPEILYRSHDVLVTEWLRTGEPGATGHDQLGSRLAALHATPADRWGGGSSWIGDCRVNPAPADTGAGFYGARMNDLAARCGLGAPIAELVDRLDRLIPPGPPALLHGDLWWGNVLWGEDGVPAVIDPSVHAGHPEEDLAMLALFGPVPDQLYAAYSERRPLADGWEDRVQLWQVYPLLVHSVLFGGSYRAAAEAAARRSL